MSGQPKSRILVAIFTPKGVRDGEVNHRAVANETLAESWADLLNRVSQGLSGVISAEQKKFDAKVFGTVSEALHHIPPQEKGTLIFLSEVYESNAKNIADMYPWIRVVVFTGADLPKGVPVIIRKQWVTNDSLELMVQ